MLTWDGEPMDGSHMRALRAEMAEYRLTKQALEDAAAPSREWWPTLDSILELSVTTDCCPLELIEDGE